MIRDESSEPHPGDASGIGDTGGGEVQLFQAWIAAAAGERARATVEGMQTVDQSYSTRQFLEDAIAMLASQLEERYHESTPWRFSGRSRRGRAPRPRL